MRMESDEFDFMAPTYVRGFLKNYARFLHVDPDPLLDEFDRRFGTGRVDTSEIIALTQRDRTPRPPRRDIPRWAFVVAGVVTILVLLTLIGLAASPDDERTPTDDPTSETSPSPEDQASPSPEQSASPDETTEASGNAAFADGIDVVIHAVRGDCYLEVTVDGKEEFIGTLGQLQTQEYKAQENIVITFGAPANVDLTIEGENLGDPSSPGQGTVTVRLPKDYERLKREAGQGEGGDG